MRTRPNRGWLNQTIVNDSRLYKCLSPWDGAGDGATGLRPPYYFEILL
jgi:hypothetical protein